MIDKPDLTTAEGQKAFLAFYGKMEQARVYIGQALRKLEEARDAKNLYDMLTALRDARHLVTDAEEDARTDY
jgi:hypothetical protein